MKQKIQCFFCLIATIIRTVKSSTQMEGKQNSPPMLSVNTMGLTCMVPGPLTRAHQVNVKECNSAPAIQSLLVQNTLNRK